MDMKETLGMKLYSREIRKVSTAHVFMRPMYIFVWSWVIKRQLPPKLKVYGT